MASAPDAPLEQTAVRLKDVSVSLDGPGGRVAILHGVSFYVTRGETVAITGPSGSGKSTIIMVATGLETVEAGSVTIGQQNLADLDEDGLALFRRDHVGIVFQSFHLIPTMTALENIAVPLELAGYAHPFERAQQELSAVGLQHRATHFPSQLSGGEQQRVALARAFAPSPRVIFADEPTGSLDAVTGKAIMDLLFARRDRDRTTLVLVTHDPVLAAHCDRCIHLEDGCVVTPGISQ